MHVVYMSSYVQMLYLASFSDVRCVAGTSVCPNDHFVFTCERVYFFLRVVVLSGEQEIVSIGDIAS